MGEEWTRASRILVWTTAVLVILGIGPPAIDFLLGPVFRQLHSVPFVISLPLSLWGFLDYALGKVLCFAIAIGIFAVLIKPEIRWQTKLVLLTSAWLAVPVVLHWAERLSHEW